jgi:hypothetical protein
MLPIRVRKLVKNLSRKTVVGACKGERLKKSLLKIS